MAIPFVGIGLFYVKPGFHVYPRAIGKVGWTERFYNIVSEIGATEFGMHSLVGDQSLSLVYTLVNLLSMT